MAFLLVMLPAASLANEGHPVADGSFIQWWLVKDWDDSRWTNEFNALKEAGMSYLVLAPTAFRHSSEDVTETIYPTSVEGFRIMKDENGDEYPDIVDACLRNAQEAGIKVFLGLNSGDGWWDNQSNEEWLTARMEEGNKVADELWSLYGGKYADTICGWYWCWEADNLNLKLENQSAEIFARAISINIDHLQATGKRLPVMFCPFMNYRLNTPREYADVWEYIFANSSLGAGDIFCPQDGIGAGGQTMDTVAQWFAALREAVNTKPGLKFWADVETFDATDWTAGTIGRFVTQLELVRPYVDNYITFAYCHYYSPYNVDPGFHNTYVDYVNTGLIEEEPPATPANLAAELDSVGNVSISWDAAADNVGVCGYYIYRDSRKIANKQVQRIDDASVPPTPVTSFTDSGLKPETSYIYEIQAYDFAGNVSAKTGPLQITTGEFRYLPNNISEGRLYKVTPAAHKNYPDTDRTELTDSIKADPSNIFDPAWQGWFSSPREVIVGLVEKRPVQQIIIGCLRDPGPSIYLPEKVTASVSDDGISYTKIGEFGIPNIPAEDPAERFSLCLTLEQPAEGKYVRIESEPAGGWTFVDEIEIRNNGDQFENDEIVNDPNDPVLKYEEDDPGEVEDLPNLISSGKPYAVNPGAIDGYPDTEMKELTDGVYGDGADPGDAPWQGWYRDEHTAVIDLGSAMNVQQVCADFMKNSEWYIYLPEYINIYTSTDGTNYTEAGSPVIPSDAADFSRCRITLTLPEPVQARYVKVAAGAGGALLFIDEIEVRNNPLTDAECVAADKDSLSIGFIGGDTAESVTGNLTLPVSGMNGTQITWLSGGTDVITADGTVTRPPFYLGDKRVILTAAVAKGQVSETKEFTVTVKAREQRTDVFVDIDPDVLNSKTSGNSFVTAYIRFTGDMKLEDIILGTLRINGTIVPITDEKYGYVRNPIGDHDGDGIPEFMAKFARSHLVELLEKGDNTIALTGRALDECFIWTGRITVK